MKIVVDYDLCESNAICMQIAPEVFEVLPETTRECARRLCVLLRLAVLLHRGRGPRSLPQIGLDADERALRVSFPAGWLEAQPLTQADLEQEIETLRAAGFRLLVG
jgi:exopolyphosphatase/guanosine-5'-triphosphate,3'-diphosphate pyrophosphatase